MFTLFLIGYAHCQGQRRIDATVTSKRQHWLDANVLDSSRVLGLFSPLAALEKLSIVARKQSLEDRTDIVLGLESRQDFGQSSKHCDAVFAKVDRFRAVAG